MKINIILFVSMIKTFNVWVIANNVVPKPKNKHVVEGKVLAIKNAIYYVGNIREYKAF
mgnify:CR=1 FL=1